jgi:hypothetical protein
MAYELHQGTIQREIPDVPRTYDVLQLPEHYVVTNVRLAQSMMNQSKPQQGATVLFATEDFYKAYIIAVLREPIVYLQGTPTQVGDLRGNAPDFIGEIQSGEIYLESTGDPSYGAPGTGSSLYLANSGIVQLCSGKRKETLILGGTTDDDAEVILQGDNGFFQGNITSTTMVQSQYTFDDLNNLAFGNYFVPTPVSMDANGFIVQVPIAEMTIDGLGNIALKNKLSSLKFDVLGNISLSGTTINFNNGVNGVARLTDTVVSNGFTDIQFWQFMQALQIFFTVMAGYNGGSPVVQSQLGALAQQVLALTPQWPTSVTSKITTSSKTVFCGD